METNATQNQVAINGVVTVPEGMSTDEFEDEFIAWLESKGLTFGGGIGPLDENELPY